MTSSMSKGVNTLRETCQTAEQALDPVTALSISALYAHGSTRSGCRGIAGFATIAEALARGTAQPVPRHLPALNYLTKVR